MPLMMKRYLWIIFLLLILLTPFVMQKLLGVTSKAKPSADAMQLIVYTAHAEGIRREFGTAFQAYYKKTFGQDVYLDYTALSTNELANILKDRRETIFKASGTYHVDVLWGGGDFYFDHDFSPYLKEMKLDPAIMAEAFPKPTLNGLPLYDQSKKDPVPHWYGAALSSFGITYNKQVLKALNLPEPTTWIDLANPGYANWLGLADPVASGSVKQAFMAIVERAMVDASNNHESEDLGWQRGMGQVRLICSNARLFASGSNLVPGLIASGDTAAGMTIDMYGRTQVDAVTDHRLAYVQPAGATVINPDPIALVDGSEHELLATRFIEFVLSRQGQLLWNTRAGRPGGPVSTNLRRLPIMPSIYDDMSNMTDQDNPYTASQGFNKSPDREKTFGILGDLIQCSCIDCLPELAQTRQVISRSTRAADLTQQLETFPFDQKEALRRGAAYAAASPVDKLAMKRAWTEEFKAEYERLRAEAMVR